MSVIRVKLNHPFTAVPNHLVNNPDISANTLAAITYLAGKPSGWITRTYDVKKRFKWGDYTWRRVSAEMRELGVLSDIPHPDGRQLMFELNWEEKTLPEVSLESVDKPMDKVVDKLCEPPVDFQRMQKPTVGNQRVYKERYTKKDLLEKNNYRTDNNFLENEQSSPTNQPPAKISQAEKKEIVQNIKNVLKRIQM